MQFITKTSVSADLEKIKSDLDIILSYRHWNHPGEPIQNQLCIKHRKNSDIWSDGLGNLYDIKSKTFKCTELDFTEWNPHLGDYTKLIIDHLAEKEKVKFGRIRFMRAEPKRGLSVHRDFEIRYHLVLKTNPYAFFGESVQEECIKAKCYHIPEDGFFYKVDTTRDHFVYNGGLEERIHLVINVS